MDIEDNTVKTIPAAANNGRLTVQKNGTDVQSFTADQYDDVVANIIVPNATRSAAVTQEGQLSLDAIEKNAAIPGTLAYELAQTNSNFMPTHQTGITSCNSNVEIYKISFFTVSKLCVVSFEVKILNTFNTGEIIRLPAGYRAYGTYHFVCDLANGTCKHAWIPDNGDCISIQNGAEKTGNLRGEVVFMLR